MTEKMTSQRVCWNQKLKNLIPAGWSSDSSNLSLRRRLFVLMFGMNVERIVLHWR